MHGTGRRRGSKEKKTGREEGTRMRVARTYARRASRHAICANVLIARVPGEQRAEEHVCGGTRRGPRDDAAVHARGATRAGVRGTRETRPATRRSAPAATTCAARLVIDSWKPGSLVSIRIRRIPVLRLDRLFYRVISRDWKLADAPDEVWGLCKRYTFFGRVG